MPLSNGARYATTIKETMSRSTTRSAITKWHKLLLRNEVARDTTAPISERTAMMNGHQEYSMRSDTLEVKMVCILPKIVQPKSIRHIE